MSASALMAFTWLADSETISEAESWRIMPTDTGRFCRATRSEVESAVPLALATP